MDLLWVPVVQVNRPFEGKQRLFLFSIFLSVLILRKIDKRGTKNKEKESDEKIAIWIRILYLKFSFFKEEIHLMIVLRFFVSFRVE